MCSMVNAYLHSVTDYCIDIWTVQTDAKLNVIQSKIDNFLICYYFPKLAKQKCSRKLSYASLHNSIDIAKLRADCNFLSLKDRSEYVTLKTAFKYYQEGKLSVNKRSLELRKCMPKLDILIPRTECLKRSLNYRIFKSWNCLPKKWDLKNMSFLEFCKNVKLCIVKKNKSITSS